MKSDFLNNYNAEVYHQWLRHIRNQESFKSAWTFVVKNDTFDFIFNSEIIQNEG